MGSLILKLVYILTALSIAADFLRLGGFRYNAEQYGTEIGAQGSALFLPGANGVPVWPVVARLAVGALTKSAIKAAKKKAKDQARVAGRAKNKAKKSKGGAEHTKNARQSTKDTHEKAEARRNREQEKTKNQG